MGSGGPGLIGRWSRDLGHEENPPRDVVLVFEPGGAGAVEAGMERVEFAWRLDAEDRLSLAVEGHEYGPYRLEILEKDLPLGRFWVLVTSGTLVPFGLRQFTRVEP